MKRDGLGNQSEITNVWFEVNGSRVSTKASISSDQTIVTSFLPALVIKAGSTASVDLMVELNGSAGSQHRFGIVAATSVDSTASTVKATFPVYTNLLTTTNYTAATVTVSSTSSNGAVKVADKLVSFGDFTLQLTGENRDVKVVAVTLFNSGTSDVAKSLSNLDLYNKATGQKVSTKTTVSGRYVTFALDDTILYTNGTRTYQVKADVVSVERSNDTIQFSFDEKAEYISVNELATGYRAVISGLTPAVSNLSIKKIEAGDFSIVKDTSVNSVTVAKNTNEVLLLAGTIKVQQPTQIRDINLTLAANGAAAFGSGISRVKLVIGTLSSIKDATGSSLSFQNTYTVTQDTPIKVYGDVKYDAVLAQYSVSSLGYTSARYSSNDQAVANPTNAFGSAGANTVNVTVAGPSVTISNNGAAATAQTVA